MADTFQKRQKEIKRLEKQRRVLPILSATRA